jgi:hypothetical protein
MPLNTRLFGTCFNVATVFRVILQAWAFMEYLDDALGPLFDFMTCLDQSTYLMFTADNGPYLAADENKNRLVSLTGHSCHGLWLRFIVTAAHAC